MAHRGKGSLQTRQHIVQHGSQTTQLVVTCRRLDSPREILRLDLTCRFDYCVYRCQRATSEKPPANASPAQRHWRQSEQDEKKTGTCRLGTLQRHGNLDQMDDASVLDDRQREQPDW